jgi:hypothetical protein
VNTRAWASDDNAAQLLLAIQCKARGWDALARTLFEKRRKELEDRAPRATLRQEAWTYWTQQLVEPDSDRSLASRHLHGVIAAGPELGSKENRGLLESLDAALVPSKAKPGSIEAKIDALLDVASTSLAFDGEEPDPRYLRLIETGFEAVPALIGHLDDVRLTRAYVEGKTGKHHLQVRHFATMMLQSIAGDELDSRRFLLEKETAQAWWEKAKHRGEEAQILASVLPKKSQMPDNHLLWLMVKKYPQQLPKIYRKLLDSEPRLYSWPVTRALAKSSVPREQKIQAYVYAAGHKYPGHRSAALDALRPLDHEQFVRLLIETLDHLPETPKKPYWLCSEREFATLAIKADDAGAWRALEKATRRVDVGLRLEFLDSMFYGYGRHQKPCVVFLTAFLDDATLRDLKSDPARFEGFPPGEKFPRLEVRNFAAMKLAELLKIEREPLPSWDAEQWAQFRDEVREALKR